MATGARKPVLHYVMFTRSVKLDLDGMRSYQKNFWCTDSSQKSYHIFCDVRYEFRNVSGSYLGVTGLSISTWN
jgi:hypothetical protein